MTINSSTGLIQWTPTATGNFNVTVKAANGVTPDATQSFINVQENTSGTCPPNIISYWKLDETNGSTYDDFLGTNNATSTNAPTPIADQSMVLSSSMEHPTKSQHRQYPHMIGLQIQVSLLKHG